MTHGPAMDGTSSHSRSLPRHFHQRVSAHCDEGLACTREDPYTTQTQSHCGLERFHAWPGFHIPNSYLHGLAAPPRDLQPDAAWEGKPRRCQLQTRHITLQRKRALLVRRPASGIDCKLSAPSDFTQTGRSHFANCSSGASHPCFAGKSVWPPTQQKVCKNGRQDTANSISQRQIDITLHLYFCFCSSRELRESAESDNPSYQVIQKQRSCFCICFLPGLSGDILVDLAASIVGPIIGFGVLRSATSTTTHRPANQENNCYQLKHTRGTDMKTR